MESLVGRASVRQLALGDSHTLFVDRSGALWACGENKEGQCGLGTPLEVIASQHRHSYYEAFRALRDTVAAVRGLRASEPSCRLGSFPLLTGVAARDAVCDTMR